MPGRIALRRLLCAVLTMAGAGYAQALDWPQEISAEEGTIVVYQPQPEALAGNVLKGRAAVALELEGREEQVFGAFWFESRIDTDTDAGTATIRDVKVTAVRWPESRDAGEQRFTAVLEAHVPDTGFDISLERLSASLEEADIERRSLTALKAEPPEIRFEDSLAVLLSFDGEPVFSAVEDSDYERALNTPFLVVRRGSRGSVYLSSGSYWYEARSALGPWSAIEAPPADLAAMLPPPDAEAGAPAVPPAIVTATKPTELIVTDGPPEWQSLPGGDVLYVSNTETAWLRQLSTGNMYVLLSGRWFRARSTDGPWTFVPADELPDSFGDIPPDSAIGGLRTSVAGTEEAEDALLDAQVPQTAAIRRDDATLEVEYDGAPQFEPIPGTAVAYAVNTGAQVLRVDARYYAVDDGVWFAAANPTGPWAVADTIPEQELQKIPPSSPVYNTTYVQIYDSTPEVVYVGYTPGYLWSYPYYGVPVYGTGWYYPPYRGSLYYPRPVTWGLHVGYNPWTGWNVGTSWSNGFFSFGVSWGGGWGGAYRPWGCCSGWYGSGYRRPVVINTGDINIGNSVNIGNRTRVANWISNDTRINLDRSRNLYQRPENRQRLAAADATRQSRAKARPAGARSNDVFTDRNGNLARRVDGQWQSRSTNGWQSGTMSQVDRQQATSQTRERVQTSNRAASLDRGSLDRSYKARQRGAARQNLNMRAGGLRGRR